MLAVRACVPVGPTLRSLARLFGGAFWVSWHKPSQVDAHTDARTDDMVTKPCILASRAPGHKGIPNGRHYSHAFSSPCDNIKADRESEMTNIIAHKVALSEIAEHIAGSDLWLQ
jgi:hypothetical protein